MIHAALTAIACCAVIAILLIGWLTDWLTWSGD
jgi:hypothetical protein